MRVAIVSLGDKKLGWPHQDCVILDVLFPGDDDEDDPLDAYMKNLENQAKTKGIYLFYILYKIISRFLHELSQFFPA